MSAALPRAPTDDDAGRVRIGVSGWRYASWRGEFYPKGLVQGRELAYASRVLSTVEINGSFYSLQRPESWGKWFDETPGDFVFGVKGPRFLTHVKRLRDIEAPMSNFFASGVLRLKHKLGPLLWQFPPSFQFDPATFEPFLADLPFDTEHALSLARQHDSHVEGRTWLEIDARRPMRHAVEIRHESFANTDFIRLLRRYNVALVTADTTGLWPEKDDVTADFVYLRLHGSTALYQSAYTDEELDLWAMRIRALGQGRPVPQGRFISPELPPSRTSRDVFCYFDNTAKLQAPLDAKRLMLRLGLRSTPEPATLVHGY